MIDFRPSDDAFAGLGPAAPRVGLRDHVYEQILQVLLSGRVQPGMRLSIDKLARQLGVSPTPVREAFVELERTGLVTREALKGYRMAPPLSPAQLDELFEARVVVEAAAARFATPASPELLSSLRQAHEGHRHAVERLVEQAAQDPGALDVELAGEFYAKDIAFHRVIFDHSGNRYIAGMSGSLGAQVHRMRQVVMSGLTDAREALAEHEAILHAFEGKPGAPTPEEAMLHHLEQVRLRVRDGEESAD